MNILTDPLIYLVVTGFISVIAFFVKNLMTRINDLEAQMQTRPTEIETRQLIQDKTEPLILCTKEIKEKLDKLFDLYIENIKKD